MSTKRLSVAVAVTARRTASAVAMMERRRTASVVVNANDQVMNKKISIQALIVQRFSIKY